MRMGGVTGRREIRGMKERKEMISEEERGRWERRSEDVFRRLPPLVDCCLCSELRDFDLPGSEF